jgi:hypothetical protein
MYQLVAARSGASNAGRHILPKSRSNHLTVLCGVIEQYRRKRADHLAQKSYR